MQLLINNQEYMRKIIAIALFILTVSGVNAQQIIDKVVAVIGDKAILKSEIESQKLQATQQGVKVDENTGCLIMEEMMFQSLLLHQAEIDSVEVTEEMVTAELEQRIQYFANQMPGGIADLEKFYDKSIEEIKEEFFTQIEDRMKSQQMQEKITSEVSVSPKDVRSFFNSFPTDSIPFINSKISVAQITIEPEVTAEEKLIIKNKLTKIRDQIINQELTFAIAAEYKSEDPGSKKKQGDFGWVTRGDFVPEFDAVAFRIPIGEISQVFESPFGYHILVINERRGEQYSGAHILLQFKVSDTQMSNSKNTLNQIVKDIEAGEITWEKAVLKYSDDDNSKGSRGIIYNQSTGSMYWDMKEIDPQLFKGIDDLIEGEISVPIYYETMNGNAYRIVKLMKRTEPHKANLTDDYQMIQNFALSKKKAEETESWVNRKLNDIYIRIDADYQQCDFTYSWTQKQ